MPMVPAVILFVNRRRKPEELARKTVLGLSALNLVILFAMVGLVMAGLAVPDLAEASGLYQAPTPSGPDPLAAIGAGIAVGVGALGAGIAVGNVGSAAVGAIAEKPEIFGRVLIFVGLAEGVAIYGLIIAFIILG
ncbi:MAG: ATPase [Anaerolineae bacterium]|nr:ATPase [Anaerolineae bacterium]